MRWLIVATLLFSCGTERIADDPLPPRPEIENADSAIRWEQVDYGTFVGEYLLPDGTRCVVYSSGHQGGITCDFRQR